MWHTYGPLGYDGFVKLSVYMTTYMVYSNKYTGPAVGTNYTDSQRDTTTRTSIDHNSNQDTTGVHMKYQNRRAMGE